MVKKLIRENSNITFHKIGEPQYKRNKNTSTISQKVQLIMPDGTTKTFRISMIVKNENKNKTEMDQAIEKMLNLAVVYNLGKNTQSISLTSSNKLTVIKRRKTAKGSDTSFKNVDINTALKTKLEKLNKIDEQLEKKDHKALHLRKTIAENFTKNEETRPKVREEVNGKGPLSEPALSAKHPIKDKGKEKVDPIVSHKLSSEKKRPKSGASESSSISKADFDWSANEKVKEETSKILEEIRTTELSFHNNLSILAQEKTWSLKTGLFSSREKNFHGTYLEALIASGAFSDKEFLLEFKEKFDKVVKSSKLILDKLNQIQKLDIKDRMESTLEIFLSKEMENHIDNMKQVTKLYSRMVSLKPRRPKAFLHLHKQFRAKSPELDFIIIQPIQRAPRYQLLLENLKKVALGKSEDFEKNQEKVESIFENCLRRIRAATEAVDLEL